MIDTSRSRKVGPVEAWIGFRLGIDPTQLVLTHCMPKLTTYEHPEAGKVTIDAESLTTRYALLSEAGLETAHFQAFRRGYECKGRKPLWGRCRTLYARAAEARVKWGEKEIPVHD